MTTSDHSAATTGDAVQRYERHVLIIGAGGYIGPVITRSLLQEGYAVRAFDAFLYGTQTVLSGFLGTPGFDIMYGDHCDTDAVERALAGITDVVILSGLVGDPITKKYPGESDAINNTGMLRLVGQLNGHGLRQVIFVSTCSNYGLIKADELADENFRLQPLSLYAKAKVAMEQAILDPANKPDYRPTVLRFATAFGLAPRMRFDLTISEFVRDMYLGRELVVYDADTWRPYCHVRDFAEVISRVFAAPEKDVAFEVFNAGGTVNNYTKRMIVEAIQESLPDAPVTYQAAGPDPRNYRVDFAKIQNRLGFEPRYTVRDGIAELIGAFRQNMFPHVDTSRNFHGNYEIDYTPAPGDKADA